MSSGSSQVSDDSISLSSVENDMERCQTHRISLINILDISSARFVYDTTDLDADREDMLSQALVGHSKYDRSRRAQKLETAIKSRAQTSQVMAARSSRQAFTASPSHNAGRFCRKPKQRAYSEGASPVHTLYSGSSGSSSVHQSCADPHSQVSVTSLNANVHLPMDRLSSKLFNPPERSYTAFCSPRRGYANGSSCFGGSRGRTTTQHYTIHPDWVSESFSCNKAELRDRGGKDLVDYIKRSQSCPPAQRNVITWEALKSANKEPDATSPNNPDS